MDDKTDFFVKIPDTTCKHCGKVIRWLYFDKKWKHIHSITPSRTFYRENCLAETVAEPIEDEK